MKDIVTIAKREIKSIFTNKTFIVSVLVIPFLLMFMFLSMGPFIMPTTNEETFKSNGYIINAPDIFGTAFSDIGLSPADTDDIPEIKQAITDGKIDLLLVFPSDFILTSNPTELCNVEMWYNSNNIDSTYAQSFVMGILDATRPATFTLNINNPENYDLGKEFNLFEEMLKIFFPTYALYCVCMASMTIAGASIAGEKENGFMNLLLISPVKRKYITFGKSVALFISNTCSAFIVMLAMFASTFIYKANDNAIAINYSFLDYLLLFLISLSGAFVITSVCLLVSAFAKNVKESNSRCSIVLIIVMLVGLCTSLPIGTELVDAVASFCYIVPALNSMFLALNIVAGSYNFINCLIATGMNFVAAGALTVYASKLFDNEKVMQV